MSGSYIVPGFIIGNITHRGDNIGLFGSSPASQAANVAAINESYNLAGGDSIDTAATSAVVSVLAAKINALSDTLQRHGLMAGE